MKSHLIYFISKISAVCFIFGLAFMVGVFLLLGIPLSNSELSIIKFFILTATALLIISFIILKVTKKTFSQIFGIEWHWFYFVILIAVILDVSLDEKLGVEGTGYGGIFTFVASVIYLIYFYYSNHKSPKK